MYASSLFSSNKFFILSLSIFLIFLYKLSKVLNLSVSRDCAVFGPCPLTPGILSIESPTNEK